MCKCNSKRGNFNYHAQMKYGKHPDTFPFLISYQGWNSQNACQNTENREDSDQTAS